jgi:hypothetical protein
VIDRCALRRAVPQRHGTLTRWTEPDSPNGFADQIRHAAVRPIGDLVEGLELLSAEVHLRLDHRCHSIVSTDTRQVGHMLCLLDAAWLPASSAYRLNDENSRGKSRMSVENVRGADSPAVRQAAFAAPKAVELGRRASPLTVGVALDAERLGGIGEVPVGPDEFFQIWSECVGRTLMTTNVGSRANLRLYRHAPVVSIPAPAQMSIVLQSRRSGTIWCKEPAMAASL